MFWFQFQFSEIHIECSYLRPWHCWVHWGHWWSWRFHWEPYRQWPPLQSLWARLSSHPCCLPMLCHSTRRLENTLQWWITCQYTQVPLHWGIQYSDQSHISIYAHDSYGIQDSINMCLNNIIANVCSIIWKYNDSDFVVQHYFMSTQSVQRLYRLMRPKSHSLANKWSGSST